MAQVGLTPKEMAELDGADGVSDGKFHGVDIADLKHDLGKSTEGWEQRPDGKWYKRDYYSASKTQAQVAVSDERDAIIATLRRELAEKDAIIADLRATISAKITIITRLESERARFLTIISQLEQQITVLQSQQQVVVQQPAPVVAMEPPGRSYYVVRSQRGADLLAHYGRNDVVVNPAAPPMVVGDWMPPMMPVMPAPAPIVVPAEYPVVAAAPAAVQVTQTEIKQEPAVSASMTQQEYYRVADEEARRRLDMMDGKLDGKLHGTDIKLQEGAAFSAGATSTTTTMVSGGAAAGGAVGLTQQEYYRVADEEARRKLDMMDGKMDGKFHGTDIQLK